MEHGTDRFPSPDELASRLGLLEDRLRELSGGRTSLLPVTKAFGADAVRAVLATGRTEVGENYAQELLGKHLELEAQREAEVEGAVPLARWHMIGGVQRNKVRRLAGIVSLWQTVDRVDLVDELARRTPGARILVQVDPADTPGKGGCPPSDVEGLVSRAVDGGLEVAGLMTVGVIGDAEATGTAFRVVARLADNLGLVERSMGMSDDLESAIEHGSTMVRIGRALFGDRPG
ncbi:MAG: alanine racemase [Acidimicrobiales bacterium]|nr:alanine racemase [Acidimicrobiales bacterium]